MSKAIEFREDQTRKGNHAFREPAPKIRSGDFMLTTSSLWGMIGNLSLS